MWTITTFLPHTTCHMSKYGQNCVHLHNSSIALKVKLKKKKKKKEKEKERRIIQYHYLIAHIIRSTFEEITCLCLLASNNLPFSQKKSFKQSPIAYSNPFFSLFYIIFKIQFILITSIFISLIFIKNINDFEVVAHGWKLGRDSHVIVISCPMI